MRSSIANIDAVVVGAGIWGCALSRRLAEAGKKVLVLEKRPVVGGNVRCEIDQETGIEIHKYGSHIFHTHLPAVWAFVNRFVKFNGYQHKVIAHYKGKKYFLPLGLPLINKFFGVELRPDQVSEFMEKNAHSKAIFDAFFRGYTSKQWGMDPEDVDPSIIKRVPVRSNYDINYFNDYWQGIPSEGYNVLFDRLLEHPNISVETEMTVRLNGSGFRAVRVLGSSKPLLEINCAGKPVYYSGPIDALFEYKFGALPWRTLRFEIETVSVCDYQGTSVVNYTESEVPYTRMHEFKHYHPEGKLNGTWGFCAPKSVIMREYSAAWKRGDEPYYPILTEESVGKLEKYRLEASRIRGLTLGGRLGAYKYYDMDKALEDALNVKIEDK